MDNAKINNEGRAGQSDVRAFEENPFDPDNRRPEDIVRLFYRHDVPIIPVVSKRGVLIGILKKDDVVSELSDLERSEAVRIDDFITRLAKKPTIDDLLPYGRIREFVVIDIFGEVQGNWSRLKLFNAAEAHTPSAADEAEEHREDQILEWMIYLILEHIPRALYAVNSGGKTIFYNSHFEELYRRRFKKDVDIAFVEETLASAERNELMSGRKRDDVVFFNRDLKIHYEKIPLMSKRKKVGYLVFCLSDPDEKPSSLIPGIDIRNKTLEAIMDAVERLVLVDSIREKKDIAAVAKSLNISTKSLSHKIKKHGIVV